MTTKADDASERALIQKSMRRWVEIDALGREMGRGLGRKELIERVALEVGMPVGFVQSVLKPVNGGRDGQ
jgi:hypothetical protein